MSRFRDHLQMALMTSVRERKLVAYHREDQNVGFFCVGWFVRFEGDDAVFLDVPKEVFGGEEVKVHLDAVEWIQTDTPYLRGLEQLWSAGEAFEEGALGEQYSQFEYIETILKEAWESSQVVEIQLSTEDASGLAQVLDIDEDAVLLQEFFDDDASTCGTRWCRIRDLEYVRRQSDRCQKVEVLLGMPRQMERPMGPR